MDPPIPSHVVEALDLAEGDVRLLTFKYATLVKANTKRLTSTDETAHDGNSKKADGGGDQGQREGESLSEEDVCALLDQHVRPMKTPNVDDGFGPRMTSVTVWCAECDPRAVVVSHAPRTAASCDDALWA